ncbi:alpha/beta hydrolase [Komagataeibacter sp. FNDCF1]|uniref:alpha/beta hydrolase n=1 Tax=Komagataeibacter sp. FNDCF1 TaxID=2878681 RepID=UPI001E463A6D|nr:alpha/beta hydrolase [Komagataeibacter sp. FNDCF1]MCE2563270.1 alpha/beta hydrolase [Komagataeibacter sp. FNDCF1]
MVSPDPRGRWGLLSQTERNLAYDNVAAVPGSRDWMAALRARSAAYRVRHGGLRVAYGDRPRQYWTLYPAPQSDAPCLVFIHGGYWQWNAPEDFAWIGQGLAMRGWSVAMPAHTLAPEASLREIVAEMELALTWLHMHQAETGLCGPRLVAGWSAGATLAALMLGHEGVRAALALSGIYELGPLRDTYLNTALSLSDSEIADLSPLRQDAVAKPMSMAYGSHELPALCEDARAFHAHRTRAHQPGWLVPVAGANHFTVLDALAEPDGMLAALCSLMLGMG